ncbi:MAG: PP2C family protein-serine/threonine phosphatase [Burkholderiales bacterium]
MKFAVAQETHIGQRSYNQDRLGHWLTDAAILLVVCDGMGGHAHGDVAAELTLRHIAAAFRRDARPRLADPDLFLFRAVGRSHHMLLRESQALGLPDTPRTTAVACVIQDGRAHWTHVGDSRLYVLRRGEVLVRTRDHTLVQQLVDAGLIAADEIGTHPERNRLLQCLGGAQPPRMQPAAHLRLERDDILLLCSDGLWGPLSETQIVAGLTPDRLGESVAALSGQALVAAGPEADNVSALALAWGEEAVPFDAHAGVAPTTELDTQVQDFGAADADFLRMTDEDIERAIAEIKQALKRHNTQR